MEKFDCNFDALEIEAHRIIQHDDGQVIYEPWDFDEDGANPDVWSVFGHIPYSLSEQAVGREPGGGRKLIADCEVPEAATFIAGLVAKHIRQSTLLPIPIYWYTARPDLG
jgi:hypothetical protein